MSNVEPVVVKAPEPTDVVELCPDKRYERYHELVGKGAFKSVYRAYDSEEGIEVAWNQIKTSAPSTPEEEAKVLSEVETLKSLRHANIIDFHKYWLDIDGKNATLNFITELMTSGTLRQYVKKAKRVSKKVIRKWSEQILSALHYLHSQSPPVVHRDLKCDNIFINGNSGVLKIGDLGLSTYLKKEQAQSLIGTPEFMAPELYDESYTEKVDVYAFGMCLLEIVTLEYPYAECENPAQIFKRVSKGIKPEAIHKVQDEEIRAFIETCLQGEKERPSAAELLQSDFVRNGHSSASSSLTSSHASLPVADARRPSEDNRVEAMPVSREQSTADLNELDGRRHEMTVSTDTEARASVASTVSGLKSPEVEGSAAEPGHDRNVSGNGEKSNLKFFENAKLEVKGTFKAKKGDNEVELCICLKSGDQRKDVRFEFNLKEDKASSVAQEMKEELNLTEDTCVKIYNEISRIVDEVTVSKHDSKGSPVTNPEQAVMGGIGQLTPHAHNSTASSADVGTMFGGSGTTILNGNPGATAASPVVPPPVSLPKVGVPVASTNGVPPSAVSMEGASGSSPVLPVDSAAPMISVPATSIISPASNAVAPPSTGALVVNTGASGPAAVAHAARATADIAAVPSLVKGSGVIPASAEPAPAQALKEKEKGGIPVIDVRLVEQTQQVEPLPSTNQLAMSPLKSPVAEQQPQTVHPSEGVYRQNSSSLQGDIRKQETSTAHEGTPTEAALNSTYTLPPSLVHNGEQAPHVDVAADVLETRSLPTVPASVSPAHSEVWDSISVPAQSSVGLEVSNDKVEALVSRKMSSSMTSVTSLPVEKEAPFVDEVNKGVEAAPLVNAPVEGEGQQQVTKARAGSKLSQPNSEEELGTKEAVAPTTPASNGAGAGAHGTHEGLSPGTQLIGEGVVQGQGVSGGAGGAVQGVVHEDSQVAAEAAVQDGVERPSTLKGSAKKASSYLAAASQGALIGTAEVVAEAAVHPSSLSDSYLSLPSMSSFESLPPVSPDRRSDVASGESSFSDKEGEKEGKALPVNVELEGHASMRERQERSACTPVVSGVESSGVEPSPVAERGEDSLSSLVGEFLRNSVKPAPTSPVSAPAVTDAGHKSAPVGHRPHSASPPAPAVSLGTIFENEITEELTEKVLEGLKLEDVEENRIPLRKGMYALEDDKHKEAMEMVKRHEKELEELKERQKKELLSFLAHVRVRPCRVEKSPKQGVARVQSSPQLKRAVSDNTLSQPLMDSSATEMRKSNSTESVQSLDSALKRREHGSGESVAGEQLRPSRTSTPAKSVPSTPHQHDSSRASEGSMGTKRLEPKRRVSMASGELPQGEGSTAGEETVPVIQNGVSPVPVAELNQKLRDPAAEVKKKKELEEKLASLQQQNLETFTLKKSSTSDGKV